MNKKMHKYILYFTIFLAILNLVQYNDYLKAEKYSKQKNESTFNRSIYLIDWDLEHLKEENLDEVTCFNDLAFNLGTACSSYVMTSYYSENKYLESTLSLLKDRLISNTHPKILQTKEDLIKLIPYIKKIKENPMDVKATEELYKLVQKIQ